MSAAPPARVRVATWDLLSIAGAARLDVRTVVAVLRGLSRDNTRQQVIDAAARLGIAMPDVPPSNAGRIRAT